MYLNKQLLLFFEDCKNRKLDIALTTVIKTTGSSFSKTGNTMLVNSKNEFTGVLGSKFLQEKVKESSKIALEKKENVYFESIPKDESSGHGEVYYETIPFFYEENFNGIKKFLNMPFSLLIFGSGAHVSPLISMANLMGWKTTVIDVKIKKEFVKDADEVIELKNLEDIKTFDLSSFDASVILSHSPITDDTYIESLLKTNMQYIGIMGNKTSAKRRKEKLNIEDKKRFFAPIGFDIGSYNPESIALSICSQIEANKNGKL